MYTTSWFAMLYPNITQRMPAIIQSGRTAQNVQNNKNIMLQNDEMLFRHTLAQC